MEFHLAQINIAKMLAPADSPVMAEFMDNLDRINAIADQSEGFVWRLQEEAGNATSVRVYNDDFILVNMSVWTNADTLHQFTYQTAHSDIMRKRRQWFEKMQQMHMVLWYIPAGTTPSVEEAVARLDHVRQHGDTPYAFGFRSRFTPEQAREYINA
ncbi:DUF3291 domain-containing protein [Pseudoflavitalea sp. G-6-1-2]|uniref:DUF3291 domain-containing protein n=1 Tax=Pseudoflavitalea sp. G-6-1-2 TaxID=2728841 RepID=UPI00197D4C75|nr:DUF3291 domain-containing protein [Pseudoflavitalea sp. G-6-1-2]